MAQMSSIAHGITRETILQYAQSLPAAPHVLGGLCELLENVNTSLHQICDEIRVDPALSARVIRLSNSVAFGGGVKVGSVDEAVGRVGVSEIMNLVGVATVAGLVDRSLKAYRLQAERLRDSLLLHALASEALARYTPIDPRSAYAAGLLRAVGMMVLDRVAREMPTAVPTFDPHRHASYEQWERYNFDVTAPEMTAMVMEEWRFPGESIHAVEHQHLSAPSAQPSVCAHVLNLAGAIVAAKGLALEGELKFWQVTPAKLAGAGIGDVQWHAACDQAFAAFERQRAAL